MFSFLYYAYPPFRDDTSSTSLHSEKKERNAMKQREGKTDGKQRDTESVRIRSWKNDE